MNDLVLISSPGGRDHSERLLALARWMGVSGRTVAVGDRPAMDRLIGELGRDVSIAISAQALADLRGHAPPGAPPDFLVDACAKLLVFSTGGSGLGGDIFAWVTGGAVTGLAGPEERRRFHLPERGRKYSRAFAGQSFAPKRPVSLSAFELGDAAGGSVDKILLADERPIFLRTQKGACELFLLALTELPDIDERLSPAKTVEDFYEGLIPLLIFLRHGFGDRCWHGAESTARLIIDDPLLQDSYGFLDFGALKASMRSAGYATSIAFIPWNQWRTSKKRARRVLGHDSALSICVHGCDHTNREFDDTDPVSLQWKADTGLQRMERHKQRTGLACDPVMVFPQGRFSSPAVLALRNGGYLAAVNTTCFPTDAGAEPLTVADFLRPAMTRFHGFPLFQRRYPKRLIDFAFDLFLGRPALIVQHHEDFRDGYGAIEAFVGGLNRLAPGLAWRPLADQLMESCMMRALSENAMEVRFFTGRFRFKHARAPRTELLFSKAEPDASAVAGVLVGGQSVPFSFEDGLLTFRHRAEPSRPVEVEVLARAKPSAAAPKRLGARHTAGVIARRALSELRDNALTRYPRLLAAATGLATRLKVTGSSGDADPAEAERP
jgi:hypothetical protein